MTKNITKTFVAKGLTLVSTRTDSIVEAKQSSTQAPTHRIAIIDRSGSMTASINKVVDDLCAWIAKVPKGDAVTIGWFSGPGQYRFVVKGTVINGQDEVASLSKILDGCRRTIGTTCFSEILTDLNQVVVELAPMWQRNTLIFFTDGCPVVPDVRAEVAAVEANLKKIGSAISHSIYVGYGDYYNRGLMADMARWGGGALVHADNVQKFSAEITTFTNSTTSTKPKVVFDVPDDPGRIALFTMLGKNPVVQQVDSKTLTVEPGSVIYWLTSDQSAPSTKIIGDVETTGVYASALVLSRIGRGDLALDALGFVGDVHLVEKLSNAYTVSEIGLAESLISDAAGDLSCRYLGGRKNGCVPKRDAFCCIDALNLLVDDEEARFYPGHAYFDYRRIGVPTVIAEGYSKFSQDKSSACPMNKLVMNETRPNVSIQTEIKGTIELTEECEKYGLARRFPTFQYKNYAIIRDGVLNVSAIPCSMSKSTFDILQKNGAIERGCEYVDLNAVYSVKLANLPVMNRVMAEGHRSATSLAKSVMHAHLLGGCLKSLKYYLAKLDPENKSGRADSILSDEAVAYLETLGVGKNGYQPKVVAEEATDTYIAKEFTIKVKGFSSLPKVDEVLDKRTKGKKQTPSGDAVLAGIEAFEKLSGEFSGQKLIEAVRHAISNIDHQLKSIRREVQAAKFSVLLGNQWFEEFTGRENCVIDLDGTPVTFEVNEIVEKM